MASLWKHFCILILHLHSSASFHQQPASSSASAVRDEGSKTTMRNEENLFFTGEPENPLAAQRKLLQAAGAALPFSPLKVLSSGEPCILFQARKLSLRFEKQRPVDLTELTFSPQKLVDTRESLCQQDKATFQLSNTFYESSGQWWFSVDRVSVSYNTSEEVVFNATDVYAPASSSYRCLHVSSLQRYSGLLLPSTEHAQRWAITFIDFQIQAFNISEGRFSPASDCTTVLTPAILMGLITSLILLLVLAYALHMVVHLKHIEHDDDQKPDIYFPQSPEQLDHCCEESSTGKNVM
ncbi:V-type proton ATPase subunit S1-like isoform X2 [Xiphophorus maculatus]|uniref:V-type proton ATPase subunit S1-like isoform X2 n=1 Tax=Xiphophorus maculatus TaxID=8083 RepID=UPI000C6EEB20|nr:V-type proton ATPase subunit S1-like isoform X2 [Xiphophorus maculatus]